MTQDYNQSIMDVRCVSVNDAGEDTNISVEETLKQRGNRYGSFEKHAIISQNLQGIIFDALNENPNVEPGQLPPYMTEAISMICHKLGRIANGDPFYDDSWRDIAGYAQLPVDILNGKDT